jgi:hypothetical protein
MNPKHNFFNKKHILISRRYQLYLVTTAIQCPSINTGAQSQKNKNYIKEKSRYNDQFLVAAALTPPIQHQKSSFSKSDTSKKEMVHKHHHRPVINLRFSPWRRSSLTKNNAFNKAIAR